MDRVASGNPESSVVDLSENPEMLAAVLDALNAHVAILNGEGTIVAVNAPWRQFASANEMAWRTFGVGANYVSVCEAATGECAEESAAVAEAIRRVGQGENSNFLMEYDCSSPTEERTYQVRVGPVEVGGARHVLVCHENITNVVRNQRRMLRTMGEQAHVLRLRTLGELSAGMAHEMNQPLAAISNFASGCIRRLENGALDEEGRAALRGALNRISAESQRAAEVIRKMRGFSRNAPIQSDRVDVNDAVAESIALLEASGGLRQVKCEVRTPDGPVWVRGDAVLLQQAITNLLKNAAEAAIEANAPEHAVVQIEVSKNQDVVEVRVDDNGPGLSGEDLKRLFHPFFSTKAEGMGLGLSISRNIVDSHHGSMGATPSPAGGLRVWFQIPSRSTE